MPPASIPDWLALVGDSADGYPGIAALGREVGGRSARALRTPGSDSRITNASGDSSVRGASALAASLRDHREEAYLYRRLATLRTDVPLRESLDDLRWQGGRLREMKELCRELGNDEIIGRVPLWRDD